MTSLERADIDCKIILIGDTRVGKTSIMRKFTDREFSCNFVTTIGIDFKTRLMKIQDKLVQVQIWDTAGQEKFQAITSNYYRGVKGVIITYDITNRKSFEHLTNWIADFNQKSNDNVERMLIGNKCDKEFARCVDRIEGEALARSNNMLFDETSAKDDINIDKVFMELLDRIVTKEIKRKMNAKETKDLVSAETKLQLQSPRKAPKKCCNH